MCCCRAFIHVHKLHIQLTVPEKKTLQSTGNMSHYSTCCSICTILMAIQCDTCKDKTRVGNSDMLNHVLSSYLSLTWGPGAATFVPRG